MPDFLFKVCIFGDGGVGKTTLINRYLTGNFEIGFQLPVYAWRKGIATTACKFLTILAFEELNAHKIAADCYFSNIGSAKTLKKCGYRQEGIQKNYYKLDSGFDDRLMFGMTREQFHRIYK